MGAVIIRAALKSPTTKKAAKTAIKTAAKKTARVCKEIKVVRMIKTARILKAVIRGVQNMASTKTVRKISMVR